MLIPLIVALIVFTSIGWWLIGSDPFLALHFLWALIFLFPIAFILMVIFWKWVRETLPKFRSKFNNKQES